MPFPGHNRRVKRWFGALIAVILACVPIVLSRATNPGLLKDSDTDFLLTTVRQRNAPFSWFTGDWPLHNHFYRPVSTLSFELDNRIYGIHAAGYGLTNALLCAVCVLLLFWFLRELTDRPLLAGGGAVIFALQHVDYRFLLSTPVFWIALLAGVVGFVRHGFKFWLWAPAVLVLLYGCEELTGVGGFGQGVIGWLPGRTATVMTVFALFAMACYARYERLGEVRPEQPPTPLDPPATRTTKIEASRTKASILWPIFSLVGTALALASYEQAVMLPAVMLAIAVTMRSDRFRVRWGWQAGFWALLVAYLLLRRAVLPTGVSAYQAQQFRHGPGVYLSLFGYGMPVVNSIPGFLITLESGWLCLLTVKPFAFALEAASNVTAFYQARRQWIPALAGYGMSFIAFLPMAWIKFFPHYNYWPMAMRSLFTATLLCVGYDLVLSACSPLTRQAPKRLDPAPGSLPHR